MKEASFSMVHIGHTIFIDEGGLYEKLKSIFYDGGCIYGSTLSHASLWTAEVCSKI